jgi:prefoldin subunit 5
MTSAAPTRVRKISDLPITTSVSDDDYLIVYKTNIGQVQRANRFLVTTEISGAPGLITDVQTLEDDVSTIYTSLSVNRVTLEFMSTSITNIEASVSLINEEISRLQTSVSANEASIADLNERMSIIEVCANNLNQRLSNVEATVAEHTSLISQIQASVSTLTSSFRNFDAAGYFHTVPNGTAFSYRPSRTVIIPAGLTDSYAYANVTEVSTQVTFIIEVDGVSIAQVVFSTANASGAFSGPGSAVTVAANSRIHVSGTPTSLSQIDWTLALRRADV